MSEAESSTGNNVHLLVLVHGMWGNPGHLASMQQVYDEVRGVTNPDADAAALRDAVSSFPSGHAAAVCAGMGFTALYLNAKMKAVGGGGERRAGPLAPFAAASPLEARQDTSDIMDILTTFQSVTQSVLPQISM